jgi:2-keto-4-pentenoate hydratase/2-oxohepta-3-ene-1,7-dioic acid hydratase in catechol pathway
MPRLLLMLLLSVAVPARAEPPLAVAAPEEALSFAFGPGGALLLVGGVADEARLLAHDLTARFGETDPFLAVERLGRARLAALAREPGQAVAIAGLGPTGAGERQIAAGANFPAHGEEVGIGSVFRFPKFGAATPSVTRVGAAPGMLLDYEVEICLRLDRDIATLADFDAAAKGFFLCGDFTDRAALTRAVAGREATSGIGFTDAKSAEGFFPTGPLLVLPARWEAFVAAERITTTVNGRPRQDGTGAGMILGFRALAGAALAEGAAPRWSYRGQPVALLPGGTWPRGAALMSGTPDGVIFRPPGRWQIAGGIAHWTLTAGWLGERGAVAHVAERFIEARLAERGFLQPGDVVRHAASRLGRITVEVVR